MNKELVEALRIGLRNTHSAMSTELSWCEGDPQGYKETHNKFCIEIDKIEQCIKMVKENDK